MVSIGLSMKNGKSFYRNAVARLDFLIVVSYKYLIMATSTILETEAIFKKC